MRHSSKRALLSHLVGDEDVEALLGDEAQLRAMLAFERALAEAESEAGLITAEAANAIVSAIDRFEPDWEDLARGMARDGVVVPSLINQLRSAVGERHGSAVHLGATSQDVVDTALVLQLTKVIPLLHDRILELAAGLKALVDRWGTLPLMAHTRMQAALPFTVAAKVRTWLEPIERHRAALSALQPHLLVVQLGGPIGDRSSFGGKGDQVARGLAMRLQIGTSEPWHVMRDRVAGFGSLLSLLTGTLGKLGADVALMAQSEVGAIKISGGGSSSAMDHKANPVAAEVLVAIARYNAGLLGTLHQAMVHENERSGAAWTLEWLTLPAMLVAAAASLRLSNALVIQISF